MTKVYPQQELMADRTIKALSEGEQFISVCMPMQAGKTGYVFRSAQKASNLSLKSFFFTGVSDAALRKQNQDCLKSSGCIVVDKYKLKDGLDSEGFPYLDRLVPEGSLLFLDEAHIAVGERDMLVIPITYLTNIRKCKLITITATPFSILASSLSDHQYKLFLTRDEMPGYFGCIEMLSKGLIHDINGCENPTSSRVFHTAMIEFEQQPSGYFLVREPVQRKNAMKISEFISTSGYNMDVIEYNQETSNIINIDELLKHPPKKHTLIVVKDFFRCGNVIEHKEHIRGVWESSKQCVDVVVQGLIGRMCGYIHNLNCRIYGVQRLVETYAIFELDPTKITPDILDMLQEKKLSRKVKQRRTVGTKLEIVPIEALPKDLKKDGRTLKNTYKDYERRILEIQKKKGTFGTGKNENLIVFKIEENLKHPNDIRVKHLYGNAILGTKTGEEEIELSIKGIMYNLVNGVR